MKATASASSMARAIRSNALSITERFPLRSDNSPCGSHHALNQSSRTAAADALTFALMNASKPHKTEGVSDVERGLLRDSVRELLLKRWPPDHAVERAGNAEAIAALWRDLAGRGLAALGAGPAEAGLREILLVFEELGRASCPAPLLGAVAANLALDGQQSTALRAMLEDLQQGKAMVALALGTFDGD